MSTWLYLTTLLYLLLIAMIIAEELRLEVALRLLIAWFCSRLCWFACIHFKTINSHGGDSVDTDIVVFAACVKL